MVLTLVYLFICFACFAVILLLWVKKRKQLFYAYLVWLMRKNNRVLLEHKNFLFLCHEAKILDFAEDLLDLTEETALLLKDWKEDRLDGFSKQQIWAYVDECYRLNKIFCRDLKLRLKSQSVGESFYKKRKSSLLRGSCYFCSQPILFSWLNRSKAVIYKKQLSVVSCHTCREALKRVKKINVLHFFYDKDRVHWSACKSYKPKIHYWFMNKVSPKVVDKKRALLKLIVSNKDRVL